MFNQNDLIDTEDEGTSGGKGAKGSLRDRLISILFRKRYEKFKLQREFYNKYNIKKKITYIRTIKDFEIDKMDKLDVQDKNEIKKLDFIIPIISLDQKKIDIYIPDVKESSIDLNKKVDSNEPSEEIQKLHKLSDVIINSDPVYELNGREIEVNPDTEEFDFDKYDYYEIEEIKKGIDIKNPPLEDKIDIKKEEDKAIDEKVIVDEIEKFIDDSLVTLSEIKEEVEIIEDEVEKPYTMEQALKLEQRSDNLRIKIDKLKDQYDTVKDKYNFDDFVILDSIEIIDAVDDYLDKAKLDNIDVMVNVCKNEIKKIEGIVIQNDRSVKVVSDIEDKKEEINTRTIAFEKNKKETKKQETIEDKIAYELAEQRKILDYIKSRVDKIEVVNFSQIRVTGYGRMFASLLRIAAGILTTPFSKKKIFGIAMGASLINKGLKGLRRGLNVEKEVHTVLKYEDLERDIINCKDKLEYTKLMLLDSIEQVDKLKKEFRDKFEKYVYLIPEYKDALDKLDNLKKKLEQKHIEIKVIDKDLDMQRKRNNEKMKRLNK